MSTYRVADCRKEAFDRVVKDEEQQWNRFCKLIARNQATGGGNTASTQPQVLSPADVTVMVRKLKKASDTKDAKPLRRFFNSGVEFLQSVKDVGTALAGLNPYAAAGWGAVAFIADAVVTRKVDKKFGWDRISVLAQIDERYQIYEDVIFDVDASQVSNAMLKDAITDFFTQVLRFQITCVIAVESRTAKVKEIFTGSERRQVDEDVQKEKQKLEELQALVAQQTASNVSRTRYKDLMNTVQSLRDYATAQNDLIDQRLTALQMKLKTAERNAVLHWISDIYYERIHSKDTKIPLGSTANWILKAKKYRQWVKSKSDAFLWLFGHMGSGKSCVAHAVIEDLKKRFSRTRGQKLIFFYCDKTDDQGRAEMDSPSTILRCMLKQLIDSGVPGTIDSRIFDVYRDKQHKGFLSAIECEELIIQLANDFDLTFVIDGLDEASNEVRMKLMSHLKAIATKASRIVRAYVSSRDIPGIGGAMKLLAGPNLITIDIARQNKKSVEAMIDAKVDEVVNDWNRDIYIQIIDGVEDQSYIDEVKNILKERAGGMFLWANVALQFLHKSDTFVVLKDRLEMLSQHGLEQLYPLYNAVFEKSIEAAREAGNVKVLWTMVMFLLHGENISFDNWDVDSYEDDEAGFVGEVSFEEECREAGPQLWIQEACSLIKHQSIKKATYDVRTLSSFCPGLICVDQSSKDGQGSLYLAHASVREYFEATYSEFEPQQAHAWLAGFCMHIFVDTNLRQQCEAYSDSFTKEGFKRSNGVFVYAASFWYYHLLQKNRYTATTTASRRNSKPSNVLVNSIFVFEDVLNAFLLEKPASVPFLSWSRLVSQKVPTEAWSDSYPLSFNETALVITKNPSTIFTRARLGLPADYDEFHKAGLLDVEGKARDGRTFGLAVQLRSLPLMETLLANDGVSGRPYVRDGLTYTLSFYHLLVDQAQKEASSHLQSELISVFNVLQRSGFDIMEHSEDAISAPVYMLTLRCDVDNMIVLLTAFLDAGLCPIHEEKYVRECYSFWTDYAMRYPQYGYIQSLVSLIADHQRDKDPQIEAKTNQLLLNKVTTEDQSNKLLAQAAQAGNFTLVSALLEAGADPFWEDRRSDMGSLCALEKVLLACIGGLRWNQLLISGTPDSLNSEVDRYRETITLLLHDAVKRENELERRKWFLSHPLFFNVVVRFCDIEMVKLWIEKISSLTLLTKHPALERLLNSDRFSLHFDRCVECGSDECIHITRKEARVYPFSECEEREYGIIALYIVGTWHQLPVNFASDQLRDIDSSLWECRQLSTPLTPLSDSIWKSVSGSDEGSDNRLDEMSSNGDSNDLDTYNDSNRSGDGSMDNDTLYETEDNTEYSNQDGHYTDENETDSIPSRSQHEVSFFSVAPENRVYDPRKAAQVETLQFYQRQLQETHKYLQVEAEADPTIVFDDELHEWVPKGMVRKSPSVSSTEPITP